MIAFGGGIPPTGPWPDRDQLEHQLRGLEAGVRNAIQLREDPRVDPLDQLELTELILQARNTIDVIKAQLDAL